MKRVEIFNPLFYANIYFSFLKTIKFWQQEKMIFKNDEILAKANKKYEFLKMNKNWQTSS